MPIQEVEQAGDVGALVLRVMGEGLHAATGTGTPPRCLWLPPHGNHADGPAGPGERPDSDEGSPQVAVEDKGRKPVRHARSHRDEEAGA